MDEEPGGFPAQAGIKRRSDILGEARSSAPDAMTGKPMTTAAPKQRSKTAEQILDLAEMLCVQPHVEDVADHRGSSTITLAPRGTNTIS